MNKNAMYVIEQPKHSIASIISMNSDFPICKNTHDNIRKLGEFTDLIFVFPEVPRGVDIEKFTTLYQGSSYLVGNSKSLAIPTKISIQYCVEVFNKHVAFLMTSMRALEYKQLDLNIQSIQEITASPDTRRPILEIVESDENALSEIYMYEEKRFFDTHDKIGRKYSSFYTPSPIIYFKALTLKNLMELCTDEFLETFTEPDLSFMWASSIIRKGIGHTNSDLLKVKINDIYSERKKQ